MLQLTGTELEMIVEIETEIGGEMTAETGGNIRRKTEIMREGDQDPGPGTRRKIKRVEEEITAVIPLLLIQTQ